MTRPKFVVADYGNFTVLPFLAVIPMMTVYEMKGLTASIQHNGLREPVVLDFDGTILVDGRCRLMACKAAGVEPRFKRLPEGRDLDKYTV